MAFYRRHLWGGMLATGLAMGAVGVWLAQTGQLDRFINADEWPKVPMLLGIGILSACFPDIDTNSKSQRLFYRLMLLLDVWLIVQRDYKSAALLGLGGMLPLLGKHRGWTHTWTAAVLVPAACFLLPMLITQRVQLFLGICFVISVSAYVSHLILDGYIGTTIQRMRRIFQ
ncbi:MAG: metal-dependent hydrolase [Candidatus Latescibacteria bacterium]|nr:metal-dependent hydrolase [Candidatus Latescibacterota bacterium]